MTALILTGCGTFGNKLPVYPELPADLKVCFHETVPAPNAGPMTKGRVMQLIAALKKSEAEKTECGRRLLAFYGSLAHPK